MLMVLGTALKAGPSLGEAQVAAVSGDVSFFDPEGLAFEVDLEDILPIGTIIVTGSKSFVELIWGETGWVRIDENSRVQLADSPDITSETTLAARLKLTLGRIWVDLVRKADQLINFEVETPTVTAGVRGTAFSVEQWETGACQVAVLRGLVEVSREKTSYNVAEEQQIYYDPAGKTVGVQGWDDRLRRNWQMLGRFALEGPSSGKGSTSINQGPLTEPGPSSNSGSQAKTGGPVSHQPSGKSNNGRGSKAS